MHRIVAVWLLCVPAAAHAWGDQGHEIVARIAEHYLAPPVRAEVAALLASDGSGLTRGRGIAAEATWADHYRDHGRESDPDASQSHYLQTREWHYVDMEIAAPDLDAACFGHPPLRGVPASLGPPQDCIVDKIGQFSRELADRGTPAAERLQALQFLLHLVGDLHQPLHAADDHDRGGNDKHVAARGVPSGSLHHYWDSVFVARLGRGSTAVAQRLLAGITPARARQWGGGTVEDWARESFDIGRAHVYGRLPAPQDGEYRLDDAYVAAATRTVRLQLERAGVRLAVVLNRALRAPASDGQHDLSNVH